MSIIALPKTSSGKIDLLFTVHLDKTKNLSYKLISSSKNKDNLDQKTSQRAGKALKKVIDAITGPKQHIKNPKILTDRECIQGKWISEHEIVLSIPNHDLIKVRLNKDFATTLSGVPSTRKHPTIKSQESIENDWLWIPGISKASKMVPIKNTGTDCFMNAVFQVIMHDDLLRNALQKTYQNEDTRKAKALCQAMNAYFEGKVISTYDLRQFMPKELQNGQQDASEFLQQLINGVSHDAHPELFSNQTTTYNWEKRRWFFGSVTETKTTLESTNEFLIPLQIPIQVKKTISGKELIQDHFKKKKHFGEGLKDEMTGKTYSPGQVQVQIDGAPKRLVFLLKRFNQNNKICHPVDMPEMMVINNNNYILKKFITHHGTTMAGGHYTSLLKANEGLWIKADDSVITSDVKDISQVRDKGYIYFYDLIED